MNQVTRQELEAWQTFLVGKACPKHPAYTIREGKFGLWCGVKTAFGWCDGSWPSEEWLNNYRSAKTENQNASAEI